MQLPKEVEKLLLPASQVGKYIPDEHDIELADIMQDWRKIDTADVGIIGIPFDTGVLLRRGSQFGPKGVREALAFASTYEPGLEIDISKDLTITDFGDIDCVHTDIKKTHDRIELVMTELFKTEITPLVIGGDHSTSYPTIKGLMNNVEGNVGVIMIDSHLDVKTSQHGEISSGTPFRRLMDEVERNPLKPENFVEIGINGWHTSPYYMQYLKEQNIKYFTAREVHKRGIEEVVKEAIDIATDGVDALFLSVDIDSLGIAYAPGTCAPSPGGLTDVEVLEAIWLIGQHPLCRGMDLLEVAPPLDVADVTSIMGSALAMNFVGATLKRIKGEK